MLNPFVLLTTAVVMYAIIYTYLCWCRWSRPNIQMFLMATFCHLSVSTFQGWSYSISRSAGRT